MSDNTKLIQTYCHTDHGVFFVSTINRQSSAMESYGRRYAETIAWEYNYETSERGEMIGMGEASEFSIRRHQEIVACLFKHGTVEPPEDDE
jgi:hypothetical protein